MTEDRRFWLDRCVELEAELESRDSRISDLESRLRDAIAVDVNGAAARVEGAERLLTELAAWIEANPSLLPVLPDGFEARLLAQMRAATEFPASIPARGLSGEGTPCPACAGAGRHAAMGGSMDNLGRSYAPCGNCGGSGKAPVRVSRRSLAEANSLEGSLEGSLPKGVLTSPVAVDLKSGDTLTATYKVTMQ